MNFGFSKSVLTNHSAIVASYIKYYFQTSPAQEIC